MAGRVNPATTADANNRFENIFILKPLFENSIFINIKFIIYPGAESDFLGPSACYFFILI